MKNAFKRFTSFMLALIMVVSVLPLSALAVNYLENTTVLDGKIKVYTDGVSGKGTAKENDDGSITITTTETANCSGSNYNYTANAHKIYIKNNTADESIMIAFDYNASNYGSLTFDGTDKSSQTEGNYSKLLEPAQEIEIVIVSKKSSSNNGLAGDKSTTATITISNFESKDTSTKSVTVMKMDGGTTTVNGTTLSEASTTVDTDYATGVNVTAKAASGYSFLGWVDGNMNVVSTLSSAVIQPLSNMTVAAVFVANDTQAYWLAEGMLFTDLNEACAAAQSGDKQVVLLKDGTLPSGTHTIPAGISVLIPKDEVLTSYGADPALASNGAKFSNPTNYRTLTLASGANLVVNGTLELAAMHHVSSGTSSVTYGGAIAGAYARIDTKSNSSIKINGTMYAWGMVTGSGTVDVYGTVYEKMQVNDYRGGTATTSIALTYKDNKLFPFSQYYVQNVEVPETIYSGGSLMVHCGVVLSTAESTNVEFVGPNGMFQLKDGSHVTKQYIASTDRLEIDLYGNAGLSSIGLDFEGNQINSANYRLGINNNIDIHIHSGVTTVSQDMILQSGATVTVDREATLYNTAEVFVMDADDWGTYARGKTLIPVKWSYSNGTTVKRTGVTDAIVDINGTVISNGQVYSTGSESIISSEGTGVYALLTPANSSATIYQLDHNSFSYGFTSDWEVIACTAAILVNGDGSEPVKAEGGQYDAFIYDSFQEKWIQQNIYNDGAGYTATLTYDANGGTGNGTPFTMDYFGKAYAFMSSNNTAMDPYSFPVAQIGDEDGNLVLTRELYTLTGWATTNDAAEPEYTGGEFITIAGDSTLYAVWTPAPFDLTIANAGNVYDGTWDVAFNTDLSPLLRETPAKQNCVFKEWKFYKDATKAEEVILTENKMPAHDLYVEAIWIEYNTLYVDGEFQADEVAEGADLNQFLMDLFGRTIDNYNFYKDEDCTEKITLVDGKMPAFDLYAKTLYTISFLNPNGDGTAMEAWTALAGTSLEDKTVPVIEAPEGKKFVGWSMSGDKEGVIDVRETYKVMPKMDIELMAYFEALLTVKYMADGKECGDGIADAENKFTIKIDNPTKEGHNFTGWLYNGKTYQQGQTITLTENAEFEAQFAIKTYTVTWEADGKVVDTETVKYGEDTTKNPTAPAKEGHTFSNWDKDGMNITDDRIIKAVYTANSYRLIYKVDGIEVYAKSYKYGEAPAAWTGYTAPEGYNFNGWDKEVPATMPAEDVVISGTTTIKTYEIKWYNDADNLIETTSVEHGGKIVAPNVTKNHTDKVHYVFAGWTKRTGTAIQNLENATATGNAEYKASFTAVSHTMEETARQDATCSATGYVNYKCKADCGYTHTETLSINPNAHNYLAQAGVWADDGTSCVAVRTCEHNPEHQETAKATIQSEIAKDATCTEPGDTKYTASFNVSWASAEPKVVEGNIPANGHTYVYESDDFVWNGYTACTVEGKCACGETATATAKMSSRETLAATCIAGGKIEHIATFAEEWVTEKAVSKFETTAVNPNNHASEKTYLYNDGDTHSVKRACCNTAVSTGHAHEYENGVCACTAIQKVLVTWFDEAGKNSEETVDYGTKINEHPNARPKTGYKFIGWDYNGEAVTSDLAINAVYEIQTYTIILDAGEHGSFDGEQTKDYEQEYGTALALIAPTENEGYVLTGWTLNGASVDLSKLETMPAENRTYVAVYGLKDVTLKFNDGTAITEKTGKYFSEIEAPTATKEGHTFQGWAASVNGNVLFSAGGKITLKDTVAEGVQQNTLYAVWQINTFDVTYKNGATTEAETYDWSTEITVKSLADTASHTFAGWKDEAGNVYAAGDKITVKSAITLTAQWNIKTYTIKFMVGNEEFDSTTVEHGQVPEIPAGTPTKAENAQFTYTFAGWGNIVAATNDATYNAIFTENLRSYDITFVVDGGKQDKTVTTNYGETPVYGEDPTKPADTMYKYEFAGWNPELKNVTGEATYTAVWNKTPVEYTVTFKIEGEGVWHHVTGGYGTAVDYSKLVTPTKTGHEFTWDVPEAEWPENYPDENVTITGKYTPKTYTITFKGEIKNNFEDDSNYIPDHVIKVVYGEVITEEQLEELKNIVPAVTGWEMIGWFLVDDPEAASPYDDAQMYDLTEPMGAGDLTLYAYWDPIPYDLTILSSIDGEEIAYNTMCYGEVYADADEFNHVNGFCYDAECSDEDHAGYRRLNVEGYTFAGYKYEDGSEMKFPIDCWPAEEMTIVAQYVPVDYTIIFMNGETKVGEITAPYGSDITTAVAAINATKEGYVFNCWTAGDKCLELKTMPLNGMTVYATFTNDTFNVNFFGTEGDSTSIISFPVVFDTDLRTEIPDDSETEEDESKPSVLNSLLEQVADPTKEGHTFVEWNTNNVPEKMPAGDVNIYGIWNVNSYDINWTVVDENGEEIGKFTETFEFGETITAPEYTAPEGYEIVKIAGTPATMPADTLDRTIEVAPKTYRITFDVEGIDAVVAAYKSEITEWPADPTKPGNTFQGWDKDNDGVADILPGSKVETMPAGGLNLKAVWTRNTVYITWNIDGEVVTQEYKYGDPIVPPAATRKPTSEWIWEFDQWVDSKGEPAEFDTATNGVEYTATFKTVEARKYAVKFVNGENVVYETEVAWNGQVTLDGFTAPELEGNALKWTVNGAEALFPYAMTTADVTFVANWTPKTYTITADGAIYTFTYNTAVSIPEPTDIGWTFDGWMDAEGNRFDLPAKMPAKDLNLTSSWIVNSYKVFFKDGDSVTEENVNYSEVIIPVEPDEKGEGYNFAGWFDENGKMLDETYTMPAEEVVFTAKWTYTGWKNDEKGTTYLIEDEIAYTNEWKTIDGDDYWFDGAGYIVKDITLIDGNYYAFNHENGHFLSALTGIYTASNNDLYYVENGIAVKNYGLYKDVDANGHIHYYIFGCGVADCSEEDVGICQGEYKAQKNNCHWVAKTNGHLMIGAYNTGADCVVEHIDDTSVNGIYTIGSTKYCLMDGVKVPAGLVKVGNDFYYARTNGALVVNQKYWVSKTNGLELYGEPIAARIYEFDAEGKMVIATDRNGFYYDSAKGAWYYYVDNAPSYEGLRYFDGTDGVNGTNGGAMGCTEGRPGYYYINTYGMVIAGKSYWVTKNNGLMKSQTYEFDEFGTMKNPAIAKVDGIYAENGKLYYYVNNERCYAGLIKYTGGIHNADGSVTAGIYNEDILYVNTSGEVKANCSYWPTKNNGLMPSMTYEFDEYGRMIIEKPEAKKNGIVSEEGKLFYYVDGVRNYAGAIEIDGKYYYVRTSGELAANTTYWVTKNNGLVKSKSYVFDANGVMQDPVLLNQ